MSLTPNLLETRGKICHLIRTNRAGAPLQSVRTSFEFECIVVLGGQAQRNKSFVGFLQKAPDNAGDRVRSARRLQLPQLEQPRDVHGFPHQ